MTMFAESVGPGGLQDGFEIDDLDFPEELPEELGGLGIAVNRNQINRGRIVTTSTPSTSKGSSKTPPASPPRTPPPAKPATQRVPAGMKGSGVAVRTGGNLTVTTSKPKTVVVRTVGPVAQAGSGSAAATRDALLRAAAAASKGMASGRVLTSGGQAGASAAVQKASEAKSAATRALTQSKQASAALIQSKAATSQAAASPFFTMPVLQTGPIKQASEADTKAAQAFQKEKARRADVARARAALLAKQAQDAADLRAKEAIALQVKADQEAAALQARAAQDAQNAEAARLAAEAQARADQAARDVVVAANAQAAAEAQAKAASDAAAQSSSQAAADAAAQAQTPVSSQPAVDNSASSGGGSSGGGGGGSGGGNWTQDTPSPGVEEDYDEGLPGPEVPATLPPVPTEAQPVPEPVIFQPAEGMSLGYKIAFGLGAAGILGWWWMRRKGGKGRGTSMGAVSVRGRAGDPKPGTYYVSTYCNFAHDLKTGRPIGHECRILPPAALRAERDGDIDKAIEIMRRTR